MIARASTIAAPTALECPTADFRARRDAGICPSPERSGQAHSDDSMRRTTCYVDAAKANVSGGRLKTPCD